MELSNAHFGDPRTLLLDRYHEGKRKNGHWSLRAYASKLGVSASALSEILSGKRTLTPKMAGRFAQRLKLGADESHALIRSSLFTKAYPGGVPPDAQESDDDQYRMLDIDAFKLIADWYHLAILSLAEIEGARADANWISKRLGISKPEAKGALERLLTLGFVEKRGTRLVSKGKSVSIETKGYEPAIRSFLHQNLDKAHFSLDNDPAEDRELSAATIAIDPVNIPKARMAMKRFRRELCRLLGKGKKQRVYTVSLQCFPAEMNFDQKERT